MDKSTPSLRLTPVAINHFSPRKSSNSPHFPVFSFRAEEQLYVLKKGGNVNGLSFSLWDDPLQSSSIPPYKCASCFISIPCTLTKALSDPDGQPKLSPDQQKNACVWKRPIQRPGQSVDILRRRILPEDILQHIVTDCSVCASISVCLEHSRRFGSTVSGSIFRSIIMSWCDIFHSWQYHHYRLLKWMADMIFGFCLMVHIVEWVLSFFTENHINDGVFLDW